MNGRVGDGIRRVSEVNVSLDGGRRIDRVACCVFLDDDAGDDEVLEREG